MEEFIPNIESSENSWNSTESPIEVSEKFKESIKRSSAGSKRTKKDEKKAKKYDFLLAKFLVKIIVDKKYDPLLETLFITMDFWYRSNFLLGIISLVNIEISDEIRKLSLKENFSFSYKSNEIIEFDDNNLHENIKNRINYWLEDIIDILTIEYSTIQTAKTIKLLKNDSEVINKYTADIFTFFLKNSNIKISTNKALNISDFIIWEVEKAIKKLKLEDF